MVLSKNRKEIDYLQGNEKSERASYYKCGTGGQEMWVGNQWWAQSAMASASLYLFFFWSLSLPPFCLSLSACLSLYFPPPPAVCGVVHVHECVCTCATCMCGGQKTTLDVGPCLPSLLETGSLASHSVQQASWPVSFWGFSCPASISL